MDIAQSCTESRNNIHTSQSLCITNSICNKPSSQEAMSDGSNAPDGKKIYRCSLCDSTFLKHSHLQDHLNHHTRDHPYRCKEINCSEVFSTWINLRRHLISSHKLNNVKKSYVKRESKRHKCSYEGCNAAYDRHWKLTSHMWKHTSEKLHVCTENGCNKAYTSVGRLRRHTAKSHKPSNEVMVVHYECPENGCEKVYKTVQNVRRHYLKHHEKIGPQRPLLNCSICDKNFKSLKHLGNHRCPSYKCEECSFKFVKVAGFKNHMKKVHCFHICSEPECSKVFSKFSLLKEHKQTEHQKSLICPTCNKKMSTKRLLTEHQQTHLLPEERKLYTCPYNECRRFYTRKFNLDQHIRSSHQHIKFPCAVPGCEKSLVTKQKLQEHMKLHDPLREPLQRKQIARRQRKDAGQPKRSMAAKLSGVSVSFTEEQYILRSEYNKLVSSQLTSISDEESESSDDWGELSDLSEELCEMIDNEAAVYEKLEGMTRGFDHNTQLCSNNSE